MKWVVILLSLPGLALAGPYPPAAEADGSTACAMDSPLFTAWATGWTNYELGAGGSVSNQFRSPAKALGPAQGDIFDICSLGDGGSLTLTFTEPIRDEPGWDFAVFENAVNDGFLELAWVEVSSDGTNFFRFPNRSLTAAPVGSYNASMDPTDLDGLAGKYRAGYGTPFDLAALTNADSRLDRSAVRWVRVRDIVGDGTSLDSAGHPIYDPYPTWGSAGFDLDAVGVIGAGARCCALERAPGAAAMRVAWPAQAGFVYQCQWAAGVTPVAWQDLGPAITGANAAVTLGDTNLAAGLKVYRILQYPAGAP